MQPLRTVHVSMDPVERRTTVRLLSYWEKLRRGRPMPSENDIHPEDISDLWHLCFLVHVDMAGVVKQQYIHRGAGLPDGHPEPDPAKLDASCARVIESAKPLVEEGEYCGPDGIVTHYRQCLLPLGDGPRVQGVFGALSCRVSRG